MAIPVVSAQPNPRQFRSGPVVAFGQPQVGQSTPVDGDGGTSGSTSNKILQVIPVVIVLIIIGVLTFLASLSFGSSSSEVEPEVAGIEDEGPKGEETCTSEIGGVSIDLPEGWICQKDDVPERGSFALRVKSNDEDDIIIEVSDGSHFSFCDPSTSSLEEPSQEDKVECDVSNYHYTEKLLLNFFTDGKQGEIAGTFADAYFTEVGGISIVATYKDIGQKVLIPQSKEQFLSVLDSLSHK